MATAALDKLRTLINELFLLDEPDLDFGLYRVMKARRAQVEQFRDHELNAVVTRTLSAHKDLDRDALQRELEETRASARKLGVTDDASVPRIQEILAQIAVAEKLSVVSDDVFSHLFAFFSRYYQSGDFHCRRQFRDGVYAIPYEGEEVKLFWANKDQYYIKTTQRHPQFEFQLVDGARVRFEVVGGSEERDNSKSSRVFMLDAKEPFVLEGATLVVRFHYDVDPHGAAQDAHSQRVADELSKREALASWYVKLADIPVGETQSLLARRLRQFMRRETFDYFIHKDLRRFLRQELDTYLKTEMMRLDDIEHSSAPRVEEYLSKLRVTRTLGHTIIDFVAQLEDFQKRLWLKKKFVLGQSWLVSMALVPPALWPAVIANDRQRKAWVKLCAIDKIERDLAVEGYSVPLTERFLEGNPSLPLDTSLFDEDFTAKLLDAIGDTDAQSLGLLVNGENFQALQLLKERFANKIKCIYIDPPYNTGGDGFAYKDNYPHSSWLSMMEDRVRAAVPFLHETGSFWMSIDDHELVNARQVADSAFGEENFVACNVWQKRYSRDNRPAIGTVHEYVLLYARNLKQFERSRNLIPLDAKSASVYRNPNHDPKGSWRPIPMTAQGTRKNQMYEIVSPAGVAHRPPRGRCWSMIESEFRALEATGRIWFGEDGRSQPNEIRYLSEVKGLVPWTWWPHDDAGHTDEAMKGVYELFRDGFKTHPLSARRRMMQLARVRNA